MKSALEITIKKFQASWTQLMEMTLDNDNFARFYAEHCTYLPPMLGWFIFSALLSSYNKYVFGSGHMSFPCPLLLTSMHFLIQWVFSHVACALFPVQLGTERVKRMGWKEWIAISLPCGMISALDIGLSNLSLVSITITFYTMVKSSTPIFVLIWAYLLGIERITWSLIGIIMVIAAGELLTVMGEVDFVMKGFLLCLAASVLSGGRWTLVQLKLQTLEPPLKTTLVTMKLLAPSMFWSMLIISMVVERPWNKFQNADEESLGQLRDVLTLGGIGGTLAIAMVLCEFYLILHSSALILMIGGVVKEMTTIVIGVTFFGDPLNAINVTGCGIVFLGVLLYKLVFHLEKEARRTEEMLHPHEKLSTDEDGEEVNAISSPSRAAMELVDRGHRYSKTQQRTTEHVLSDDDMDENSRDESLRLV